MLKRLFCLSAPCFIAIAMAGARPAAAQRPGGPPDAQQRPGSQVQTTMPVRDEPGGATAGRFETAGPKEEKVSQTSHALRLDGRDVKYTATASS
jgi:hypothetical protein